MFRVQASIIIQLKAGGRAKAEQNDQPLNLRSVAQWFLNEVFTILR